ncbi:ester cyclase [Streptomyces albipurpureus]|uniref:Ester cyclase n=1 Tax=Streptomyces albipurpureus TaxID=2897419 RepID=A0ABT0UKE3_9ACTN|nr:nuclear transport factor 2 family protein [Streptomyces sp. CWNU-1]MCM2388565.1 ester cyclase [Streptomyces sp. CWNU-1]
MTARTESGTRSAVTSYLEALNGGDPDQIAERVTEDFHNEHTSTLGKGLHGRQAYRERLAGFLAEFQGLNYEIEDLLVDGDRAALAYRMSFTWAGAAHRPEISIRGVFRFRVKDGRVAHRVDYWDSGAFHQQTTAQRRWRR